MNIWLALTLTFAAVGMVASTGVAWWLWYVRRESKRLSHALAKAAIFASQQAQQPQWISSKDSCLSCGEPHSITPQDNFVTLHFCNDCVRRLVPSAKDC